MNITIIILIILSILGIIGGVFICVKKYLRGQKKNNNSFHKINSTNSLYNLNNNPNNNPNNNLNNNPNIIPKTNKLFNTNWSSSHKTSYTYNILTKSIPKHSLSMSYLDALIKNEPVHKICCNPECKRKIDGYVFCAFDGFYCSMYCRNNAIKYISNYWYEI